MGYDEFDIWMPNTPDKYVCPGCISDSWLAAKVKADAAGRLRCSYCGRFGAAPLQILSDAVLEGIAQEWTDPVDELMYISREGGYQGEVMDGEDLVLWVVDSFTEREEIASDVAGSLQHLSFTKRNYGLLFRHEALGSAWSIFSDQVKHHTRYLFLTIDDDDNHPDNIPPGRMLTELGDEVQRVGCTRVLPKGSTLTRVRVHAASEIHETASALGSPPPTAARRPNRMSPAGIPMFYAALDPHTALAETLDPERDDDLVATLGTWMTSRDSLLLDLTDVEPVPSLYNESRRHLRGAIRFLRRFSTEIAKPISVEEEHLEYVPTQIITEYFRHLYRTAEGAALDGILYKSSRTGKPASVFFCGPRDCGEWDGSGTCPSTPTLLLLTQKTARLNGGDALSLVQEASHSPS